MKKPRVPDKPAAVRMAPGGGRLTVDEDHPELVALLFHARLSLDTVGILSDWLRDRDDARADAVLDLAAPAVVPDSAPGPDEEITLVTGRWWGASCQSDGVYGRVRPGTEFAALTGSRYGSVVLDNRDRAWHHFVARTNPQQMTPTWIAASLRDCRTKFVCSLFGLLPKEVADLHFLNTSSGVRGVGYPLRCVPAVIRARWLRKLRRTNPRRCAAIVRGE